MTKKRKEDIEFIKKEDELEHKNLKMNRKAFTKEEFLEIYKKVPRQCVDLLVQTDKGILLTKREIYPSKGCWHLPGGTVLFKETFKEAVEGVAKNELNLDVEIIRSIGEMEFFPNFETEAPHSTSIAFLVKTKNIEEIKLNEQASDIMFCKTKEDIPKITDETQAKFLKKFFETGGWYGKR